MPIVESPISVEQGLEQIRNLCKRAEVPFPTAKKMIEQIRGGTLKDVDAIAIVAGLLRARKGVYGIADEQAIKRAIEERAGASLGGARPRFETFLNVDEVRQWAEDRERTLDKRLREMSSEKKAIDRELWILGRLKRVFHPVDDEVDRMGRKKIECDWPGCGRRMTRNVMASHKRKHMREAAEAS